jgi:hypothetical protein
LLLKKQWAIPLSLILIFIALFGLGWPSWHFYNELERAEAERAHIAARSPRRLSQLLPKGLTWDTDFAESPDPINARLERATTTVGRRLREIGAYCKDGILYDREGRKVVFREIPEWGHFPTKDHEKARWRLFEEIEKLEAEGVRVIQMWRTHMPF